MSKKFIYLFLIEAIENRCEALSNRAREAGEVQREAAASASEASASSVKAKLLCLKKNQEQGDVDDGDDHKAK